jgi:integration host factor subunit alpha
MRQRGGKSAQECKLVVEQVFDQITSSLVREETVKLSGFGLFTVHQKKKKERLGRNPKTGEPAPISARRVVSFRPSAVLKDKLNSSKPASLPATQIRTDAAI